MRKIDPKTVAVGAWWWYIPIKPGRNRGDEWGKDFMQKLLQPLHTHTRAWIGNRTARWAGPFHDAGATRNSHFIPTNFRLVNYAPNVPSVFRRPLPSPLFNLLPRIFLPSKRVKHIVLCFGGACCYIFFLFLGTKGYSHARGAPVDRCCRSALHRSSCPAFVSRRDEVRGHLI